MKKLIIVCVITLVIVSCNKNQIYKETISFKNYKWERLSEDKKNGNFIEFKDIDVKKIDSPYDIYLIVRHLGLINIDNVKLLIEIISPSGTKRTSNVNIKLKDRNGKKFIGDVMGDFYDVEEKVKSFMSFTETGNHTIKITNLSSSFEIIGIIDMTLKISKSELNYNI
ncbi:MAG: gliding motility lipoprotein GldH [Bacteroidales bacterium]|nr:gliding motility lipoprotein GldH [Bacteroidales bacterium]